MTPGTLFRPRGWAAAAADDGAPLRLVAWQRRPSCSGRGCRPARCLASRLGGGGADAGGRGRRAGQPLVWAVTRLPLAQGGDRRAAWPRVWAATALVAAAEDGAVRARVWAAAEDSAPLRRMAGWWRPSCRQWMGLGALFGLAAGQRLR
jgi:hypothetical protein